MALQTGIRIHQYLDDWLVRATSHGFQLRRLPVRPQEGQGQRHTRTLADLNSHRKAGPLRSTAYETHTVAQLESTRITRKGDTCSQDAPPPLKVVAGGRQCPSRSTITPTKTCSADIYRCIKRRVGSSLKQTHTARGTWSVPESKLHITKQVAPLGAKSGLSGPKRVPRPLFKRHSPGSHRQPNSGCLYQQRGG